MAAVGGGVVGGLNLQIENSDSEEWNLSPGLLSSLGRTSYTPTMFVFLCVFVWNPFVLLLQKKKQEKKT